MTQKYRRNRDRYVVDAYQYGEGKPWNQEAITKVVAFVTGVNVDDHTVVSNERVLDVVRPILSEWDQTQNKTPIEVANWPSQVFYRVNLGDWIVRIPMRTSPDKTATHLFLSPEEFYKEFVVVKEYDGEWKSEEDLDIEALTGFLWEKVFYDFEDEEKGQELSEKAGNLVVKAGWRRGNA